MAYTAIKKKKIAAMSAAEKSIWMKERSYERRMKDRVRAGRIIGLMNAYDACRAEMLKIYLDDSRWRR